MSKGITVRDEKGNVFMELNSNGINTNKFLRYDKSMHTVDEIKEYFTYLTKAPQSVVDSFFKFVTEKLSTYGTDDLKDLYFNYQQYLKRNTFSATEFVTEVFGRYYLGNGHSLIRVLKSIEDKDKNYNNFKIDSLKESIKTVNVHLESDQDKNKEIEIDSKEYQSNLQSEMYWLKRKQEYVDKLNVLLSMEV